MYVEVRLCGERTEESNNSYFCVTFEMYSIEVELGIKKGKKILHSFWRPYGLAAPLAFAYSAYAQGRPGS